MPQKVKDKQLVEILGRNRLVNELLVAGIEIARPERDQGIDLIAYIATDKMFKARPLQLKVASNSSFSIHYKYERFADLLLVYVWGLQSDRPNETYALTYDEAVGVADAKGYTRTKSWNEGQGSYGVTYVNPESDLANLLVPYRMTPDKWRQRIME